MAEKEKLPDSVFNKLNAVNVMEFTEKKGKLTYLTWTKAWNEVKSRYPDAQYSIVRNPVTNLPYFIDEKMGIIVFTTVTIEGQTHEMWLPVMDGANNPMKLEPYSYTVYNKFKGTNDVVKVDAADMFDINKTIMRCFAKNLAMFGLGLNVYAGEDLPLNNEEQEEQENAPVVIENRPAEKPTVAQVLDMMSPGDVKKKVDEAVEKFKGCNTRKELKAVHDTYSKKVQEDTRYVTEINKYYNKLPE